MRTVGPGLTHKIANFGGNIQFRPRRCYRPATEEELLQILDRHAGGAVRAVGALHSWSDVIACGDVLVSLAAFAGVELEQDAAGVVWATVGAGVTLKKLLATLNEAGLTLPATPASAGQTLAGAISTGAHGSGMPSLSHFVGQVRMAAYDPESGQARIFEWDAGPELRAASCSLGCMGIILSVRVRCIPQYSVFQIVERYTSLAEALEAGRNFPLQELMLTPYHGRCYAFNRRPLRRREPDENSLGARIQRAYRRAVPDFGGHAVLRLLASILRRPELARGFVENVFPLFLLPNTGWIDRSDRVLVGRQALFRHVEMEAFVPAHFLAPALELVGQALAVFAGVEDEVSPTVAAELERAGLLEYLTEHRASYSHHYPIVVRRVPPDDAMLAMTAGAQEPYYSISLFSYTPEREGFYVLAAFLAGCLNRLYQARLHWGKYFPLANPDIEPLYPELEDFRRICARVDPNGVFLNTYARQVLGFTRRAGPPEAAEEVDI